MSTQNIINVCLAICITFLIYQNNKLSDEKMDYYDVKRLVERCVPEGRISASEDRSTGSFIWIRADLLDGTIEC